MERSNPGYNSTKRNRNIGTSKQGHGQNNKMVIPWPGTVGKSFYERLGKYKKTLKPVGGKEFTFVIEETRKNSIHAVSVADILKILEHVPADDLKDLELIVLRQPKRKEESISPVWGRFIYYYDFEKRGRAAIILETVDFEQRLKWPKHLSVAEQNEFERLCEDGHPFVDTGRQYETNFVVEAVRNTHLYRTLAHEIGHYVQYLEVVERPGFEEEEIEIWQERNDRYWSIPAAEKEQYAHQYAETLRKRLLAEGIIPFEPLAD